VKTILTLFRARAPKNSRLVVWSLVAMLIRHLFQVVSIVNSDFQRKFGIREIRQKIFTKMSFDYWQMPRFG
jgi:hypothetical protein